MHYYDGPKFSDRYIMLNLTIFVDVAFSLCHVRHTTCEDRSTVIEVADSDTLIE